MTEYRRPHTPDATWFFTLTLAQRKGNRLLLERIEDLREAIRTVKRKHAFAIDAMVVLPEHLHAIWTQPPGEHDIGVRWGLIKANFSRKDRIARLTVPLLWVQTCLDALDPRLGRNRTKLRLA